MSDIDRRIITLLRDNARIPVSEIATRIGVSRATVQKHLDQMEANGTISGYTVRIRQVPESDLIRAWMSIAIEGNKAQKIIHQLQGEAAIATLHTTNGRWDILVEIHTRSLEEFDKVLGGFGASLEWQIQKQVFFFPRAKCDTWTDPTPICTSKEEAVRQISERSYFRCSRSGRFRAQSLQVAAGHQTR